MNGIEGRKPWAPLPLQSSEVDPHTTQPASILTLPEATVSPSATLSDLLFTVPHATNLSHHGSTQTPYPSVKNRQTPIKQKTCSFVVHAIQLYHLPNLTGAVPHFCKLWGPDEILPVDSKCWYNPGFICTSFHL